MDNPQPTYQWAGMKEEMVLTHQFTEAGLGLPPFRFDGISENLFKMADGSCKPGSSCDYCLTAIRYEYHILSANGQRSKVGSECIRKVADTKLIEASKLAKKKFDRQRKLEKQRVARELELNAQRERNAGLTNAEVREMNEKIAKEKALLAGEKFKDEASRLWDGKGGFRDSIASGLLHGRAPVGRGLDIMLEILAKQAGRRNSRAFETEYTRLEGKFRKTTKRPD